MKHCLRHVAFLLLVCVMTVSLSACHGNRKSTAFTVPSNFDDSREYNITFWAKNDTNKNQTRIYEKAVSDFQKIYPNIHVDIRLYTDYTMIYNDVITNISTNTTPNVCITYPDHIATYLQGSNVVAPLDELMADAKYGLGGSDVAFSSVSVNDIVPEYLNECRLNGNTYALPFMRSTEICYINKTFVEKLGYTLPDTLTWDFVYEVSQAATRRESDGTFALNGQQVLIPFIYKSTDNMMITQLAQLGAPYSDDSGKISIFSDTTANLLREVSAHIKDGSFSTFKISGYPANFLNAGQCVFAIDSSAGSTWMGAHAPLCDISPDKIVDFETAVMTIPQFDPSSPKMISQGPSVCVFNKEDPMEVMASWLFTQYLLTNDVQIAYSETEGYVPVTETARNSEAYLDYLSRAGEDYNEHYDVKIKSVKLLLENTSNTFVTPVFPGSASLRAAAGEMIENVAKSTRRKKDIDDAFISSLYTDMISLYHLDVDGADNSGENADLGPLPAASQALLLTLAGIWVIIAIYGVLVLIRKHKNT